VHDGATGDGPSAELTRSIALSPTHTCVHRQTGLYCWGSNSNGQLGTGDTEDSVAPVAAAVAGRDIAEVAASNGRTCVRRSTGEIACWGANERGQIGDGTRSDAVTAVAASGIGDAMQLAIQDDSTCALRTRGGRVECWGGSLEGSDASGSLVPRAIEGATGLVELKAGVLGRYCGRSQAGSVRCWRIGDDEWTSATAVSALAGARSIAVPGHDEVCAIVETGAIVCHNLDSGNTLPLPLSTGSVELVTAQLWGCARNGEGLWRCWNILPTMLETVGAPAFDLPSEVPLVEVTLGGLGLCAVREDDAVVCGNANDALPLLTVVNGLAD